METGGTEPKGCRINQSNETNKERDKLMAKQCNTNHNQFCLILMWDILITYNTNVQRYTGPLEYRVNVWIINQPHLGVQS